MKKKQRIHSHQSIQVHPSYKLDSLFEVLCKHTHPLNEDNSTSIERLKKKDELLQRVVNDSNDAERRTHALDSWRPRRKALNIT